MSAVRGAGMLRLLALMSGVLASAYEPPALHSMVEDPGHVLTPQQQEHLATRLGDFRRQSGFAVVVFVPVSLEGQTVEDLAYQTFNRWKLGDAGQDNGVLLVLAPAEHKVRIETGRGVGGQLTDIESGKILREQVIPHMKAGQPYDAAVAGTDAIVAALGAPAAPLPPVYTAWDSVKQWGCSLLCLLFAITFIYALFSRSSRKGSGGGGARSGGGWGGGSSGGGGSSSSGGYSGGGGSSGGGGASGSY